MQETTKKYLPVIIFLAVIVVVGIIIFAVSDKNSSSTASGNNQKNNQPQVSASTENSDPIDNINQLWSKGNSKAKVQITEYSDFQCPYCKKGADTMSQIFDKYKDQIYVTFSHFPLTSIHQNAFNAAKAAEAAGYQGKFWEMHDLLFANQSNLTLDDFISYAKKLGLDVDKFEKYYNNTLIADKITNMQKDTESKSFDEIALDKDGNIIDKGQAKIEGTPAYVINGKLVVGAYPADQFEKFILNALK